MDCSVEFEFPFMILKVHAISSTILTIIGAELKIVNRFPPFSVTAKTKLTTLQLQQQQIATIVERETGP